MSEDEQKVVEELQAELAKLKVSDLLLQTLYTVSSLGYHRMSGEMKDLEQARVAIGGLKGRVPVRGGPGAAGAARVGGAGEGIRSGAAGPARGGGGSSRSSRARTRKRRSATSSRCSQTCS